MAFIWYLGGGVNNTEFSICLLMYQICSYFMFTQFAMQNYILLLRVVILSCILNKY